MQCECIHSLPTFQLLPSPSEKSALEPVLKRAARDGSLARIFASSPHILEIVQNAINHSIVLSKTYKARTMQMRQDASGNTPTELEQLQKTVCVMKCRRETDWDGGGVEHCEALFTIGVDPDHSIYFSIDESGEETSSVYVSFGVHRFHLQYATPDQYHEMITRWGLTTSVDEIQRFLEGVLEFVRQSSICSIS